MENRKMKRKSRAKVMLPEIKELIAERALGNDKSRNIIAQDLDSEIRNKYPNEIPPTFETLLKRISEARKHAIDPLDEAWNLGTLEDYPLPSESIPYILKIQETEGPFRVTIRQAKWISKLIHVIRDIELLDRISWYYAFYEKISIISHSGPFTTSKYDKYLVNPKKQKTLVRHFQLERGNFEWELRRKATKQLTGMPVGEEILEYEFQGDEVTALTNEGNRYKLATRDFFINNFLPKGAKNEIFGNSDLTEGNFTIKPKIRTFYHNQNLDKEDD
jgi:hypothetical protein